MKKIISLLLILVLIMSTFAACGDSNTGNTSNTDTEEVKKVDEMNIAYYAYSSEPILNWDPSVCFSNGVIVLSNVYETLLKFDPDTKEFINVLATDYSSSEDGMTWNFKLREGVKFHDGSDFTAEDVKYSIERTMEIGQGASYIWFAVEEINVISDYEVEFKLFYPTALDIAAAAPYAAFMMPSELADKPDNWFEGGNEIGTGPYVLENNSMGDEVILAKFDGYWQDWNANQFDKVIIKKTPETSSRRQLLEKGEADITMDLPSEDVEALKGNSAVNVQVEDSFTNLIAFFNNEKEELKDVRVRQALSYAFPYDDIVNYAAGGYAKQSTGVIPTGMWGHSDELFQYSFDLDKAKELLAEAGVKDGDLKLLLTYLSGDEMEKKAAELYKSELSKIGVELEIRGINWESQWEMSMATDPNDRQDIFVMYWWPDVASPYSWLYSLFHTEEEILFNLGYYYNEDVDMLMDDADATSGSDLAAAEELFIQAQEILIEDAAAIFALDTTTQWIVNPTFKGFVDNPAYPRVIFFYDTYREK